MTLDSPGICAGMPPSTTECRQSCSTAAAFHDQAHAAHGLRQGVSLLRELEICGDSGRIDNSNVRHRLNMFVPADASGKVKRSSRHHIRQHVMRGKNSRRPIKKRQVGSWINKATMVDDSDVSDLAGDVFKPEPERLFSDLKTIKFAQPLDNSALQLIFDCESTVCVVDRQA
jgi:hypothetical protein